jgi:RNA polymerase sigma factor (sigma-70 family)
MSLDHNDDETGLTIDPADDADGPEELLEKSDSAERLNRAMETLSTREALVIRFRYEELMTLADIAKMLGWDEREAVNLHKSAIYRLRKALL